MEGEGGLWRTVLRLCECNMVHIRNPQNYLHTRKENLGKDEISNIHIVATDSFFGVDLLKAENYWLFSMIYINMFRVYLKWRINKRYSILFSLPEPAGHCAGSPEQSKWDALHKERHIKNIIKKIYTNLNYKIIFLCLVPTHPRKKSSRRRINEDVGIKLLNPNLSPNF